jgi:hypothetical protein
MWTVLATLAMALGMTVGLTTTAQAATYYNLVNYKANKCLSLADGGSTANGTNVVIYTCNGAAEQRWYLVESGAYPGWYYIKNAKAGAGKCISVDDGGSTAKGAAMILWTCTGAEEQRWRFADEGGGWAEIQNFNSGHYMSLDDNGSTANNTRVIQWTWVTPGPEQVWGLAPAVIDA